MATEPPTTKAMFLEMFNQAPVVPAAVHRAAWRHTKAERAIDLAKLLVARADAPEDLVAEYATLTTQELRAVYLARPDVDDTQVADGIAGERRASVLRDAIIRSGNNPTILATAAAVFLDKPTKALIDPMRTLPAAQMTPQMADAILTVYSRFPLSEPIPEMSATFGHLGVDRARAWLPRLEHPALVSQLLGYDVGDDVAHEAATRILRDLLEQNNRYNLVWRRMYTLAVAESLLTGRRDGSTVAVLTGLLRGDSSALAQDVRNLLNGSNLPASHRPWPEGAGDETRPGVTVPETATVPRRGACAATATVADLCDLAASQEPGTVAAVAARLAGEDPDGVNWTRAYRVLMHNPALSVPDRHHVIATMLTSKVDTRAGQVDAVGLFPDDDVVRDIWCDKFPDEVLNRHGWEPFGGRANAAHLVPAWAARPDNPGCVTAVALALGVGIPAAVLLDLPMPVINGLWAGSGANPGARPQMARFVTGHVANVLGDDTTAWALFVQLKGNFTGTLGELLDSCRAAAA